MVMSQSQSYRGLADVGGTAAAAGPTAIAGARGPQAESRDGSVDGGGRVGGGGGTGRVDEGVDFANSMGSGRSTGRRRAALKQGVQGGVATLTRLAKEMSYESYQNSSRGSFTMSAFSSNRSSTDSEDSEEEQMRAGRGGGGAGGVDGIGGRGKEVRVRGARARVLWRSCACQGLVILSCSPSEAHGDDDDKDHGMGTKLSEYTRRSSPAACR